MFNEKYYIDKKVKLLQGFTKKKDATLQGFINLIEDFLNYQSEFKANFAEIDEIMKQGKENGGIIVPESASPKGVTAEGPGDTNNAPTEPAAVSEPVAESSETPAK